MTLHAYSASAFGHRPIFPQNIFKFATRSTPAHMPLLMIMMLLLLLRSKSFPHAVHAHNLKEVKCASRLLPCLLLWQQQKERADFLRQILISNHRLNSTPKVYICASFLVKSNDSTTSIILPHSFIFNSHITMKPTDWLTDYLVSTYTSCTVVQTLRIIFPRKCNSNHYYYDSNVALIHSFDPLYLPPPLLYIPPNLICLPL